MLPAHRNYFTAEGRRLPSVTEVLRVAMPPALIGWANKMGLQGEKIQEIIKKKATIGTLAHYFAECDIKNETRNTTLLSDYSVEDLQQAEKYFGAFLNWKQNCSLEFIESEIFLTAVCPDLGGFVGTIDAIARRGGKEWIIDFKTTSGIYFEHRVQVAAYAFLADSKYGHPVYNLQVVRLIPDGSFEVWKCSDSPLIWDYFRYFLCCLQLFNERRALDDRAPVLD